jgi:U4/U6 small nuclear ribonucleoprotein PRP3
MPTLKANIRAQKKEQIIKFNQDKQTDDSSEHKFYDSRVDLKTAMRPKRAFKFHEKGTFENLAQRLRTKVFSLIYQIFFSYF